MGRTLCWFIIPKNIEHDSTKLCLDLEFEPEKDDHEVKEKLYKKVNPEHKNLETIKKFSERLSAINEIFLDYKCDEDKKNIWCPKCYLYIDGLYESSLVIASKNISHSYSNPIWNSDWCIKDFYMGSSTTNFVRRFDKMHMYREISKDDILETIDSIKFLGDAIRTSDRNAKKETLEVLEFLKLYMNDESIRIIMEDET